ncbi:MAG: hypothetical protein PHC50_00585 [Candidatus Cloacimonetes bacterium]|nr:hypothetical protein [Candidatus Cloacimonadota bacterium]
MKISGFSFVRNGEKLYYPTVEAIKSILPICDEFVIAIGKGDEDDHSRELVAAIGDPKIRIIDTVWDEKYCIRGMINSYQTDVAMKACTGDWLFYVQADEVVHEKYLPAIVARCEELLEDTEVEGLLFKYRHFWGDYQHYHGGHGWYPWEIRIVRNLPKIHSYQSAQSFRWFDYYEFPRQETGTRKLKVAKVDAYIYHYGWVRPPHLMQRKSRYFNSIHWGKARAEEYYNNQPSYFDYGPLDRLEVFEGSHPAVMQERIKAFDWADKLQYSGRPDKYRKQHKHERPRVRLLSILEKFAGPLGTFKNYKLLKR